MTQRARPGKAALGITWLGSSSGFALTSGAVGDRTLCPPPSRLPEVQHQGCLIDASILLSSGGAFSEQRKLLRHFGRRGEEKKTHGFLPHVVRLSWCELFHLGVLRRISLQKRANHSQSAFCFGNRQICSLGKFFKKLSLVLKYFQFWWHELLVCFCECGNVQLRLSMCW